MSANTLKCAEARRVVPIAVREWAMVMGSRELRYSHPRRQPNLPVPVEDSPDYAYA
jgi:hypothetical protein